MSKLIILTEILLKTSGENNKIILLRIYLTA